MKTHKTKRHVNHIYSLRRNRGYLQKHVAALLGHRNVQMVSQYENGKALPPLKTAMLLEIALGAKLSEIYVDIYRDLTGDLLARSKGLSPRVHGQIAGRLLGKDPNEHSGVAGRLA